MGAVETSGRTAAVSKTVFSGVRPSSGAEMLENDAPCEISDTPERAEIAAAEGGRTAVNKYESKGNRTP